MDDAVLHERMLDSMEAFFGLDPNSTIRRPGVLAAVCPPMGHRSVFNSVVYRDAGALREALPDLASAYEEAGVTAWTVWTPEEDGAARAALESAGHALDASPRAMAAPLGEIDAAGGAADLDWERTEGVEEMCGVLEEAFGWESGPARRVMRGLDVVGHVYVARADGTAAACVAAYDSPDGDCGIWNVGTREAARGRGLATGLMRQAALDARERGCTTTSLQATAMGRPVYARIGYRDLGALEMWERRTAPA